MTILLFEPKKRLASFLEAGLHAQGIRTDSAEGPVALKKHALRGSYELIVMGGDEEADGSTRMCRDLRRSGIASPILILSEIDSPDAVVGALRSGADDYLAVPFSFDEFLARAEALMRRASALRANSNEIKVGDLVIDLARHSVTRGGRSIELTPREYKLLVYMMSAPGQVFSRTRIHERVWGYDRDPLTNVVEVYIRRLRTKIEVQSAPKLIHTVRGFGYKVEAIIN